MKIKVVDLKKRLKEYNQKELIELVVEMFKMNKDIQNYLSSKYLGEEVIVDLFKKARTKIENEFFPDRGDAKLRLAQAKNAINEFKKATGDEKRTIDLMLFYVEQGVEFTCAYGDMYESFYISMVKMFGQVALECDQNEDLYRHFANRLRKVIHKAANTGWGFSDGLMDSYYLIGWVEDENEDK